MMEIYSMQYVGVIKASVPLYLEVLELAKERLQTSRSSYVSAVI